MKLIQISKREKEFLIENGLLATWKGMYPDLHITSKRKKKGKTFYVPDYLREILKKNKNKIYLRM